MAKRNLYQTVLPGLALLAFSASAAAGESTGAGGMAAAAVASRWAHILAAIVMLGGSVFLRFILMPSVSEAFGQEGHARLRPVLMRRWRRVVHTCIALFLASGLYNYFMVTAPRHAGQPAYHALFGIKFLLALAVFALASILVSGRERPSPVRANTPLWLGVTVGLAVATVLIGGIMKFM
ncbi:MAG TPA: hypothetical protein PKI11_10210 [Candidatus Hydrogenedentes bacterium]|nr:hypothetical protein [Candidatus Hydrogenedentota bacterium]HNT88998.1 hypothetical protein [Candidatus Hydrogenedentota bacterium]